jgi:SAM-dependent methyltransferase
MSGVFNDLYADNYDLVYQSKNYELEVEAVSRLMTQYGSRAIRTVLDLGCGTGRHAVLLAARGLDVTGVDQSEPMLARARERAAEQETSGNVEFMQGDVRDFELGRTCDAALMMFNVLGYMWSNDDLLAALRGIRRHLRDDGLFAFDIWYGPAVVTDPPRNEMKEWSTSKGTVIRYSSGCLRPHEQLCDITIRLLTIEDGKVSADGKELHKVRYFFPLELDIALQSAGFRLLTIRKFPQIDEEPSVDAWGAIVVAMAQGDAGAALRPAAQIGR